MLGMKALKYMGLVALLFLVACATADPHLWPPQKNEAVSISVYCDGFHSVIVMPDAQGQSTGYAYAEEAWVLEDSRGCWGQFRAMLLPSQGMMIVTERGALPDKKYYPQRWNFKVSPKGLRAMGQKIESMKDKPQAFASGSGGRITYYYSNDNYYVFNTCNTFTAEILESGGLPISSFWMVSNATLINGLDELRQNHVKEGFFSSALK